MKRLLSLFFWFAISFEIIAAAHQTYQSPTCVRPQGGSEGISLENASVLSICKDKLGFMWFWSDYGLYCFDGNIYRSFRSPMFGLEIKQIEETPEGFFLLLAGNGSIYCFDRNTEQFIPTVWTDSTFCHNLEPTYHPSTGLISAYEKGLLHIAYRMNRSREKTELVLTPVPVLGFNKPLHLAKADPKGNIYAVVEGTHDVVQFDLKANKAKYFHIEIPSSSEIHHISRLFVFDDEFWFSFYWSGMFYCNTKTKESLVFDAQDNEKDKTQVNYIEVQAVAQEAPGSFYMASWNGCLHFRIHPQPGTNPPHVTRSPYLTDIWGQSIEQRAISIYCDQKSETLWVGTLGGGVVRYCNDLNYNIPLYQKSIYQITEDKRGYVWLSTVLSGVLRSNSTTIDEQTTFSPWNKGVFSSDRQTIYNDGQRYIWFADNRGNIIQVDQFSEQYRELFLTLDGTTHIREGISAMCLDADGRFWVASFHHLYYWDTNKDQTPIFKQVTLAGVPKNTILMHLIEDREGLLWLGTQQGLYQLRGAGDTYYVHGGYEQMVGSNPAMVYALKINSRGDILASYGDRLTRIDNSNKEKIGLEFHAYDQTLPSSHILSIVDDKYGNTWLGTNTSIMVVKSGGNYVSTYSLSNSNRDVCRLEDGRLLWTSADGLTYFHPKEIREEWTDYHVELSRLTVNGKDVYAGVPIDGEVILRHGLSQTDTLTLSERHSNFELYFSDLSFTPFEKRVLYKLEPLMDDWQPHVVGQGLSFPQLSSGTYHLLIKPIYAYETEGQVQQMTIIIRPLWYRSTGFVLLFIALSIGALWLLFISGLKRLQRFRRKHIHRLYEAIQAKNEALSVVPEVSTGKILIIGPDKEATDRIADVFKESEFELFCSHNSADALIGLLYHLPKVVVCSWELPDALEFCRKAKENVRSCTVPIVMIDSVDIPEHRMEAVEARADDYIVLGEEGSELLRQVVENRMSGREAMNLLLSRMIEEKKHSQDTPHDNRSSSVLIRQIEELVLEHAKDPTFSVRRLAELLHMSQSTLYRKVLKAADGRTVIEVMRDVRLRRASELLTEGNLTISAVAEEVGYLDVATFRKHFSDLFGVNPSGFIKMQEYNSTPE